MAPRLQRASSDATASSLSGAPCLGLLPIGACMAYMASKGPSHCDFSRSPASYCPSMVVPPCPVAPLSGPSSGLTWCHLVAATTHLLPPPPPAQWSVRARLPHSQHLNSFSHLDLNTSHLCCSRIFSQTFTFQETQGPAEKEQRRRLK